jgi:hypothetical protein
MKPIDRRTMLRDLLGGAAVATVGPALTPDAADTAPLTLEKNLAAKTDRAVEQAQVVIGPRRRRRWVCWWSRGRRVCGWRWV